MAEAIDVHDLLAPPGQGHEVHLSLTPEEAQWLQQLMGLIGGHPASTPRRHFDAIGAALRRAGVARNYDGEVRLDRFGINSFYFRETDWAAPFMVHLRCLANMPSEIPPPMDAVRVVKEVAGHIVHSAGM